MCLWIVGAGLPQASAAGLPRVVLVLPGLAARVARLGHGVPSPDLFPGFRVEGRNPAPRLRIACAVGDDDLALGGDGRGKELLPAAELVGDGDHLVPDDFAGVAIDRDHAAIRKIRDDQVLPQRDASRARHVTLVLHARIGDPHKLAAGRRAEVDLVERAPPVGRVHHAVVDEGVDLVFRPVLPGVLQPAERHRPDHPEVLDVVAIDLREFGIPCRSVVAVHHQPVLRLVLGVDEALAVHGHRVLRAEPDAGGSERRREHDADGYQHMAGAVSHDELQDGYGRNYGSGPLIVKESPDASTFNAIGRLRFDPPGQSLIDVGFHSDPRSHRPLPE